MNKGKFRSLVIIVILLSTFFVMMSYQETQGKEPVSSIPPTRSLPIRINSDEHLRNKAFEKGWGGSGSIHDPYVIEELEIIDPKTKDCLFIGNTTDHLVIRNCSFTDLKTMREGAYSGGAGIYLYNCMNVNITNNNCSSSMYVGIRIEYCHNIRIMENYCCFNNDGIFIYDSTLIRVEDNQLDYNGEKGIYVLNKAEFTIINNNTLTNNFIGIKSGSDQTYIISNNLIENTYGIYLSGSTASRVLDNIIIKCHSGISEYMGERNLIHRNIMKDCYEGVEIDGSGETIIQLNTIQNGSYGMNCRWSNPIIEGNSFINSGYDALFLSRSDHVSVISNTFVNAYRAGIYIDNSEDPYIDRNLFTRCGIFIDQGAKEFVTSIKIKEGNLVNDLPIKMLCNVSDVDIDTDHGQIFIFNCTNISVGSQSLVNCSIGIEVFYSENITIRDMNSSENFYGALILESANITLDNSTFHDDLDYGICCFQSDLLSMYRCRIADNNYGLFTSDVLQVDIRSSSFCKSKQYGIYFYGSSRIRIQECEIFNNSFMGIYIGGIADEIIIKDNLICSNPYLGIYLNIHGARVYNNTFKDNYMGIHLAYCQRTTLADNVFENCGVVISGGGSVYNWIMNDIDRTNKVNGKDLLFLKNLTGTSLPSEAGQVIMANCTDIDVTGYRLENSSVAMQFGHCDNIRVTNNRVSSFGNIRMEFSSNFTISSNLIIGGYYGINVVNSNLVNITENTILSSENLGIYLDSCLDITVSNNTLEEGIYGISGFFYSGIIEGNEIGSMNIGISASSFLATIRSNICRNISEVGISLTGKNIIAEKNDCLNCGIGIFANLEKTISIINNTCRYNEYGISINGQSWYHTSGSVFNNTLSENEVGLYIYDSNKGPFSGNIIVNNSVCGIEINDSWDVAFYNNILKNNGFWINGGAGQWSSLKIPSNNTVNDLPVCFKAREKEMNITEGYGQIILSQCDQITISEQSISNATSGILLGFSENITIKDSQIGNNTKNGMFLHWSKNIMIEHLDLHNNSDGMEIENSRYINISHTLFNRNIRSGLLLKNSKVLGMYNDTFIRNRIGLNSNRSQETDLVMSTFFENRIGLNLTKTFELRMSYSTIEGNEIGFKVNSGSKYNRFHHNDLLNSSILHTVDDGEENHFDDNRGTGNFWDDYRTRYPDAVSNGRIWNIPYEILQDNGSVNSMDRYPLVDTVFFRDVLPPIIIDLTSDTAQCGRNFTFLAEIFDDSGIKECIVEYHFDHQEDISTIILGQNEIRIWSENIFVPNELNSIFYRFRVSDNLDHWNITPFKEVEVIDEILPSLILDSSDRNATTGDPFTFRVEFDDNIGILSITVEYWYGAGSRQNEIVANGPQGELAITIPANSTRPLYYKFIALDLSSSSFETGISMVIVRDNDPPVADPGRNITILVGDIARFDGTGSRDNIGIISFDWAFRYQGGTVNLQGEKAGFRFNEVGTYRVLLTVRDAEGYQDSSEVLITVEEKTDEGHVTVLIGPVKDTEGALLDNVHVILEIVGYRYHGTTEADGFTSIEIPETSTERNISVILSKKGYHNTSYEPYLHRNGDLDREPPPLERMREPSEERDGFNPFWLMLLTIVVIAIVVVVILIYMRRSESWDVDLEE